MIGKTIEHQTSLFLGYFDREAQIIFDLTYLGYNAKISLRN